MNERIYLSPPDVTEVEERAVLAAVRSGWVAPAGPDLSAFEEEVAAFVGMDHAVALSSGTAGLHLGLLTLGVRPGDVVLTSTMTFAATANAIVYTGAEPYFIDSELTTGNMDPNLLEEALEDLNRAGEKVRAIVPVDLLGKAANYSVIEQIAARYEVPVLADAAESLGARHAGRMAGSFGKASVVSFNGNKIMTTSGGGMLLTDLPEFAAHVRYLSTQARAPVVHYEHHDIGYNYRLSNLLAALGRAQLARLESMIERRRALREQYKDLFEFESGVEVFGAVGDADDNAWLTSILVNEKESGWSTQQLLEYLHLANIESRPLWKPMHMQPIFANGRGLITGTSQRLYERGLTLPSGSALGGTEVGYIFETIQRFLEEQV